MALEALKILLLPPLGALILYLVLTYGLVPLWQQYIVRSRYSPLAGSISTDPAAAFDDFANRVSALVGRGRRDSDSRLGGGFLSDEELEEGLPDAGRGRTREGDGDRRLSRELEGGFMDDSDEEEGARTRG